MSFKQSKEISETMIDNKQSHIKLGLSKAFEMSSCKLIIIVTEYIILIKLI